MVILNTPNYLYFKLDNGTIVSFIYHSLDFKLHNKQDNIDDPKLQVFFEAGIYIELFTHIGIIQVEKKYI